MTDKSKFSDVVISKKKQIYKELTSDNFTKEVITKLGSIMPNREPEFVKGQLEFFLNNFYDSLKLKIYDIDKELQNLEELKSVFLKTFKELNRLGITSIFYQEDIFNYFNQAKPFNARISREIHKILENKYNITQNVENASYKRLQSMSDNDIKKSILEEEHKKNKSISNKELQEKIKENRQQINNYLKNEQLKSFTLLAPQCHDYIRYIYDSMKEYQNRLETIKDKSKKGGAPRKHPLDSDNLFFGDNFLFSFSHCSIWLYIRLTNNEILGINRESSGRKYNIRDNSKSNNEKIENFLLFVHKKFYAIIGKVMKNNAVLKQISNVLTSQEAELHSYGIDIMSFPALKKKVKKTP